MGQNDVGWGNKKVFFTALAANSLSVRERSPCVGYACTMEVPRMRSVRAAMSESPEGRQKTSRNRSNRGTRSIYLCLTGEIAGSVVRCWVELLWNKEGRAGEGQNLTIASWST